MGTQCSISGRAITAESRALVFPYTLATPCSSERTPSVLVLSHVLGFPTSQFPPDSFSSHLGFLALAARVRCFLLEMHPVLCLHLDDFASHSGVQSHKIGRVCTDFPWDPSDSYLHINISSPKMMWLRK